MLAAVAIVAGRPRMTVVFVDFVVDLDTVGLVFPFHPLLIRELWNDFEL